MKYDYSNVELTSENIERFLSPIGDNNIIHFNKKLKQINSKAKAIVPASILEAITLNQFLDSLEDSDKLNLISFNLNFQNFIYLSENNSRYTTTPLCFNNSVEEKSNGIFEYNPRLTFEDAKGNIQSFYSPDSQMIFSKGMIGSEIYIEDPQKVKAILTENHFSKYISSLESIFEKKGQKKPINAKQNFPLYALNSSARILSEYISNPNKASFLKEIFDLIKQKCKIEEKQILIENNDKQTIQFPERSPSYTTHQIQFYNPNSDFKEYSQQNLHLFLNVKEKDKHTQEVQITGCFPDKNNILWKYYDLNLELTFFPTKIIYR